MPDPSEASVLFLGDVVLDQPYPIDLAHPAIVFNLEGPLVDGPHPRQHTWNLKVDGCHLEAVFKPLPRAVSLANNHIMDYGLEALEGTRALLGRLGVETFGVGPQATAFGNPMVLDCGGLRVGILGYAACDIGAQLGDGETVGAAPLLLATMAEDIRNLQRQRVDRIIVYPHWGVEHASLPAPETVQLAHQLIDLGVDLIVGTHTHCMQAFETYKGKPVYYGLGNFIFPSRILPGQYDTEGRPTQFGRTVLLQSLRDSLGVEYFPGTGEVRRHYFHFDSKRVVTCPGQVEDITALTQDPVQYEELFLRRLRLDLFRYRLGSLFKNPRPSRIFRFLKHAFQKG